MVTWQYAVVPTTFQAPAGITYQVLSQIHIPTDTYVAVETEAERLASIQDSIVCSSGGAVLAAGTVQPNVIPVCPEGYHWDYSDNLCAPNNCPTGYHWSGTACVADQVSPPPPSADQAIPAGNITVTDFNLNTTPGVRNVRIVAKRWFKIERSYTDNVGHFLFTKRFKHKVKIVVKFKNSYCNIRSIRGLQLWQSLYVVRKTIGVYSGDKSNIPPYNFGWSANTAKARSNGFWVAATTINAVQEHRDYSTTYGFTAAPLNLNIYISNLSSSLSSTPLFGKRYISNFPSSFATTFLVNHISNEIPVLGPVVNWYVSFFATIASTRLDIAIGYNRTMDRFTSDFIKETVYHELSHASHYAKLGNTWYNNLVMAELAEIVAHPLPSDPLNPYGSGASATNSPIIALGEAWGYHMGHFLADQRYGTSASSQIEQPGNTFFTGGGAHPHIDVLEAFNPNLTSDPFNWIPKGLMEDLIDATNETNPITDNVSGFTISQLFNALQSDVTTLQLYRARIISQNPSISTINITNLFGQYHY